MDDLQQFDTLTQPPEVHSQPVQHNLKNIHPTSAEINHLWTIYTAENMARTMLTHMVAKSTNPDFYPILQAALDLAQRNTRLLEEIFNSIEYPFPQSVGEKDVNPNAPALFDDAFAVRYTRLMTKYALINHTMAFSEASRSDLRALFSNFMDGSRQIIEKADQVLLEKGLFPKSPYVIAPNQLDYIKDTNYYGSIFGSLFEKPRPLNVLEIANIFAIMDFKMALQSIHLGFSQVVRSDKLRKHFNHGRERISNHLNELLTFLEDSNLPGPEQVEFQVTDSKEPPYSDKLMLLHISSATTHILFSYGFGLTRILRKDVLATYTRLATEVLSYSKDCMDLLIENGWIEKIPEAANRQSLTH